MLSYLGVCDKFRKTEHNEEVWQEMMKTKTEISEQEFLKLCDIQHILDEEETWVEYKENARLQNDSIKFYKSENSLYFFQKAGFEFIWG